MNLLHLDSSILGEHSASRALSAAIVERLKQLHPDLHVVRRDLVADPLPHLDLETHGRLAETTEMKEYLAADIVVIGLGFYNFSLPSQLKSWIDRIAARGVTFAYQDGKPVGLAANKRVIVAMGRGGVYAPDTPYAAYEHAQSLLASIFGFLGITPEFVVAEGLAKGEEARAAAMEGAMAKIAAIPA